MRKALLMGIAGLILSIQTARAESAPTEQQWLSKLKASEQSFGKSDARYGEMLFAVGNFYHKNGNAQREQAMYGAAMHIFEKSPGKNGDMLRFYSDQLARVYAEEGKYEQAESLFKRAVKLSDQLPGKDKTYVVPNMLAGMAEMYMAQGRYADAEAALKQRIEMRHRFMNAGQIDVAKTELANLYTKWGKLEEAKTVIDELLTMPNVPSQVKDSVALYSAAKSKTTN